VRALARVPVVAGDVAATLDHPADGLDAEVSVAPRLVARQLRRVALDVEAVVARAPGGVVPQETVVVLRVDQETINAAALDHISAHSVVRTADEGMGDSQADARPPSVADNVVGDQVVVALLDPDAVAAVGDAVSGDHVMTARAEGDAGVVSHQT